MNICVIGQQWGDKGKGKVVNVLAEHSDIIVRSEAARRGLRKP